MAIALQDTKRIFHKVGSENMTFEASNQDTSNISYHYFGYIAPEGSWIIQRFHFQESGDTITYEYYAGQKRTVYDAQWGATGKYTGSLTFVTFDQIASYL